MKRLTALLLALLLCAPLGAQTIQPGGGGAGGNVSGPASSTSGNIATFNGATGKTLQDSGLAVSTISPLAGAWTSYTPTVAASSGTFTSVSATGNYIQIGKTVFARFAITITTVGTATGNVTVTLPFSANGRISFCGKESSVNGKAFCSSATNSSTVTLTNYDNTSPIAAGAVLVADFVYEST
jgi:hypothetical protein